MKSTALLIALCCAVTVSAKAATLKPFTTLDGATVRLSDLWDGVTDDKPLGPAPAPGGRITVPAAQLAAIARDYGVDWHPNSSGDRAILERPGRALTRDDIKPALTAALASAGASADADIDVGAIAATMIPSEGKLDISVQQTELDVTSGRFSALVDVAASGSAPTQFRVTGHVQEMLDLPVARRRLLPGDTITAADLDWARLRANPGRGDVVRTPRDAIGLAAKRAIQPGQPIPSADLGRAMIVQKGENVTLTLESPGLAISARGTATEPGGLGDHIRVLNALAHSTVEAEITGPGQARVVPGTARPANRFVAAR